jgi:hypothetical protein
MSSKVFIIRISDPLDMEGAANIFAIFANKEKAEKRTTELRETSVAEAKKMWGERWDSFAFEYEVEEWDLSDAE